MSICIENGSHTTDYIKYNVIHKYLLITINNKLDFRYDDCRTYYIKHCKNYTIQYVDQHYIQQRILLFDLSIIYKDVRLGIIQDTSFDGFDISIVKCNKKIFREKKTDKLLLYTNLYTILIYFNYYYNISYTAKYYFINCKNVYNIYNKKNIYKSEYYKIYNYIL